MDKRKFLIIARLVLGVVTLAAVILQALFLYGQGVFNVFNYLGYFTNLSNLFAAIVFTISALYLTGHRQPSARDDLIRSAAALYMIVTGVVYVTLLSNEDLGLLMPWVNTITHIIMPVAVIADWLYQPPKTRFGSKQVLLWLVFPGAFLVYTMVRGAIVGWYPYPFLNPDATGGYAGVVAYGLGILALFFVLGWGLVKLGGILKRHIN